MIIKLHDKLIKQGHAGTEFALSLMQEESPDEVSCNIINNALFIRD